jgi:alpha-amylase
LISYLRERATPDGRFVGMMGDDGEKFGAWPGTHEYCWGSEHWVDRCFDAIEANADWLTTVTPSAWLQRRPPTTRAYFPTASYVEMTEWVLPPDEMQVFTSLLDAAREQGLPAARFLRGGFWRNFAARYREINELHKQMLRASSKVEEMAPGPSRQLALDHLYQGQSNDCYWHGLFGGIYIVHMRMATLAHLIAAEDLAEAAAEASGAEPYGAHLVDTDLDAIDEVLVALPNQTIVVDPAHGAAISNWDLRASRVALASVLRRRSEVYHERLVAHDRAAAGEALGGDGDVAGGGKAAGAEADVPRTIHDIVASKEPGLAAFLHYDRHERRSGLVHLLPADGSTDAAAFVESSYEELGDFTEGPYEPIVVASDRVVARRLGTVRSDAVDRPLIVEKTYRFGGDRSNPTLELATAVENLGDGPLAFELAVEWNVNLMGGGHNPAAYYETEDADGAPDEFGPEAVRTPHDVAGELASASTIAFGNDHEGVRIVARPSPVARLTWYPVETVSNSEAGFERVYQGSSLLFRWPVSLDPGERRTYVVRFDIAQGIDQSAAELG